MTTTGIETCYNCGFNYTELMERYDLDTRDEDVLKDIRFFQQHQRCPQCQCYAKKPEGSFQNQYISREFRNNGATNYEFIQKKISEMSPGEIIDHLKDAELILKNLLHHQNGFLNVKAVIDTANAIGKLGAVHEEMALNGVHSPYDKDLREDEDDEYDREIGQLQAPE